MLTPAEFPVDQKTQSFAKAQLLKNRFIFLLLQCIDHTVQFAGQPSILMTGRVSGHPALVIATQQPIQIELHEVLLLFGWQEQRFLDLT
jgi:hypothetical protein